MINRKILSKWTTFPAWVVLGVFVVSAQEPFSKITAHDGKLYAGGEELLLVSVGYTHDRPGQDYSDPMSYKDFGYDLVDLDLQRIHEAGFNAIRTWSLIDEQLLTLAQKHHLWVVGGIRTERNINPDNENAVNEALATVAAAARVYARHPNTAMLLLLNEPELKPLAGVKPNKLRNYLDRLAAAARENYPGIPVGISNWPNAGFIDSDSWDVIAYNVYANSTVKFQKAMGYRGYLDAVRRRKAAGKPFFVSEFGFYSPVPRLNPNDTFKYHFVPSEEKQAALLVDDMEALYQSAVAGGALMQWKDNWWMSQELFSPALARKERQEGYVNKDVHDLECIEWSGLLSMDKDPRGVPRPAFYAVQRANQAIMTEPDSETIYRGKFPISVHLTDAVEQVELIVDGKNLGRLARTTPEWFRSEIAESGKELKRHDILLRAFDKEGKLLREVRRYAWTAEKNSLPALNITWRKDEANRILFLFHLSDEDGRPVKDARINWGALDSIIWTEDEGSVKTQKDGTAILKRPMPSNFMVLCAGYEYQRKDFKRVISDIYFFKQ